MKKIVTIALSSMMLLSLTACSGLEPTKDMSQPKENNRIIGNEDVQIPNPFREFTNLSEAEQFANFTIKLPSELPDGYKLKMIEAVEQDMLQIIYGSNEDQLIIRKAKANEDMSGDYNEYAEVQSIMIGDKKVETRGDNGKVRVSVWFDGEFSYAISLNSAAALEVATLQAMIQQIS